MSEVAEKVGVHRDTVYVWLARYEQGGLQGLADRSHRPRSSPLQMVPEVEMRVLELRRLRPGWGPARIAYRLDRDGVDPAPSRSGIYRALRRAGLIEPAAQRKKLPAYRRWERGRPMELWQMDVVGGVLLADGTECKVVTGLDDHSRVCVCAGVLVRAASGSCAPWPPAASHAAEVRRRAALALARWPRIAGESPPPVRVPDPLTPVFSMYGRTSWSCTTG